MKKRQYINALFAIVLLGVYSASVYRISADRIALLKNEDAPIIHSYGSQEEDKRRILDVVKIQEFVTVDSNISIPGAECEFNLSEIESQEFSTGLSTCLENRKEEE